MQKVKIGLPPERNIFYQVERYEPLMTYVGRKAGVKFELKVFPRYAYIVNDFEKMGLDGAFFGSLTYVIANKRMGHKVIARPEGLNGVSSYHGMIFVKKGSRIRFARDMRGKKMAVVDSATATGCLLPRVFFSENGIDKPKEFLKEIYFAGTHEDAIHDVIEGRADIGAAKNTVFQRMLLEESREINGAITVLGVSPEFPENSLAFRPDLDKDLVLKIREALLSMHKDPEGLRILKDFGALRFVEATDGDYESVRRYAKKAGVDPATLGCRDPQR